MDKVAGDKMIGVTTIIIVKENSIKKHWILNGKQAWRLNNNSSHLNIRIQRPDLWFND